MKKEIFNIIKKEGSINKKDLLKKFEGIPERTIRNMISDMIEEGYPIASNTYNGYYIVDTQEKLIKAISDYKSRIRKLQKKCMLVSYNYYNLKNSNLLGIKLIKGV